MNFEKGPERNSDNDGSHVESETAPAFVFKQISADDIPRLKEHWVRMAVAHPEEYNVSPEDMGGYVEGSYRQLLKDPAQIHFSEADTNGNIVGTVHLEIDQSTLHLENGKKAEVKAVAVHPDKRGQKIGEQMMQEIIGYAKQNGFSTLTLFVRRENAPAKNLYAKCGFVPTGKVATEEWNGYQFMEEYILQL